MPWGDPWGKRVGEAPLKGKGAGVSSHLSFVMGSGLSWDHDPLDNLPAAPTGGELGMFLVRCCMTCSRTWMPGE